MLRKKLYRPIVTAAIAICVLAGVVAQAQDANYPFPQNVPYPHGYDQSTITSENAETWWRAFKTTHVKPCAGKGIMPTDNDINSVKVEGMGWAMIAAAYMGDKENFDGFYQFYNANRRAHAGDMMVWQVTCDNIPDNEGSATDGDLDVAFALIVASWQWGGNYLDSAISLINRSEPLIKTCPTSGANNGPILALAAGLYSANGAYGAECDGNDAYTDLSYYTPAFFRVFADVTGKDIWERLANDTYIHLERNAHPTTGLISDWQNVITGAPMIGPSISNAHDTTFRHDASRVAWRISLDYLWNGNERAKVWLTKVTDWVVNDLGVDNLKEGHNRDGSISFTNPDYAGMAFVGSFATGSLANENTATRTALLNKAATMQPSYWYHTHTGNMYMLALTGNMWTEDMFGGEGFRLRVTTTAGGGGVVTRDVSKIKYEPGTLVKLTATADAIFEFDGWEGDASGKENPLTVTMDADKNIVARFKLVATGNLVNDGTFEDEIVYSSDAPGSWVLNRWKADGSGDDPDMGSATRNNDGTVTIDIKKEPGNVWDLQLVQVGIPLIEGVTYVISFDIKATAERDVQVQFQNTADFSEEHFSKTIKVSSTEQKVVEEYIATATVAAANGRLGFNLGQSTDNVTIGNVSVVVKPTSSVRANRSQSQLSVNRFVSIRGRTLFIDGARDQKFNVRVVNMKGKTVAKHSVKGGANVSLKKLPAGVYMVEAVRASDKFKDSKRMTIK